MALATYIIMLPDTGNRTEITGTILLAGTPEPLTLAEKISAWLEMRMPMMLTIWSGGVAILMIRLAFSLGWVRHMRNTANPEVEIQLLLNQIIQRLRLNIKPGAAGSGLVSSPLTIGHLKPLILFPVGIINQLSPKDVEAILTHELAHIVRRDYLSNLVQSFIETLFYYHPITWWISGVVRAERENRADDLAISWCGDHLGYAKALMAVQEMQVRQGPALAIGFASKKGAMLARIQRILNLPYKNHNQMEKKVLLSLSTLCFLTFTLSSHTAADQQTKSDTPADLATVTVTVEKTDSIPSKGTYLIHKKTDDQDVSIKVEDGDIKELTVDGKEIQPSEFDAYGKVIEDLFGEMDTPSTIEGYAYQMPPMPGMPMMPPMPPMDFEGFEFEMPEMPEIPQFHWEQFFHPEGNDGIRIFSDSIWIFPDSLSSGQSKIIIIQGGDSSVICTPHFGMGMEFPGPGPMVEDILGNPDEWRKFEQQWREQAEEWRKHQDEWRQQSREQADQWRAEQERMRSEIRHQQFGDAQQQREIEQELSKLDQMQPLFFEYNAPRLSLSDQMVRDGLVQPGAEVEVQLTPDKLKINGEKMPDSIHQRYLKMYEEQQGIELSGNSKVEFTTKSKQRM
jgi:beta-lactamase regulating signal transducer with metallopeptidase domain